MDLWSLLLPAGLLHFLHSPLGPRWGTMSHSPRVHTTAFEAGTLQKSKGTNLVFTLRQIVTHDPCMWLSLSSLTVDKVGVYGGTILQRRWFP